MAVRVPVVFACDEAYALPLAVALESLLKSKKPDTVYAIYCLVPAVLSEEVMARMERLKARKERPSSKLATAMCPTTSDRSAISSP